MDWVKFSCPILGRWSYSSFNQHLRRHSRNFSFFWDEFHCIMCTLVGLEGPKFEEIKFNSII